jgi:hypothetical protein
VLSVGLVLVAPLAFANQEVPVQPGQSVLVHCEGPASASVKGNDVTVTCASDQQVPADQPAPAPLPPAEVPAVDHAGTHPDGLGPCGEPLESWHPPVINGCAAGEEHGDAPPAWISNAGYQFLFHGPFNTSPIENTAKHAAMKGFLTRLSNVDIYFRTHAASNPLDRSARFHSYEAFARDPSGSVSHWQGWYNTGDPNTDRIPRRVGTETDQRPVMLVVDQTAWDQGIRCEQWYAATAAWSWDFGWTICNTTTLYVPGENATASNPSTWIPAPDGSTGTTRRLEVAWYGDRSDAPRDQKFWATQFGDIVSGPTDPRCSKASSQFGQTYDTVCLEQYISSTLPTVKFPGNAEQKEFDATGVHLPN